MDRKIDEPYLKHIRDAINLIQNWTNGKSLEDFLIDQKLQSAVIRQIEIIGEAASKVSRDMKIITPEIPWRPISDARNTLIHGYFTVDNEIVWGMVKNDIPKLNEQIEKTLKTLS